MAAPLLHQHLQKHLQTTLHAEKALHILKHAFPGSGLNISANNLAVPLPHKDIPTYLLTNNKAQPWELLPTKAAALEQYPNFFNAACMFFGSINRDLVNRVPLCVVPPTKVGLDLALVLRNLGIINDFELFQKRSRLRKGDMLWPRGKEPEDMIDVKLYMQTHLRLKLRWDLHKPLWSAAPTPESASTSPSHPLHLHDHLPLSVKSISKASQPIFMYPQQIIAKRTEMQSGIFLMYHHSLGIITDAQALLYDVPGLVIAHLGLPHSHATQISGALRLRFMRERAAQALLPGGGGRAAVGSGVVPLKSWSMVDWVSSTVAQRQATLDPSSTAGQAAQIEEEMLRSVEKMRSEVSRLDVSDSLHEELVAWEITQNNIVERVPRFILENEQAMLQLQKTMGRGSDQGRESSYATAHSGSPIRVPWTLLPTEDAQTGRQQQQHHRP
ncbi:MAG: hypothetical protein WDW38_008173 [Sanguina aurantia]